MGLNHSNSTQDDSLSPTLGGILALLLAVLSFLSLWLVLTTGVPNQARLDQAAQGVVDLGALGEKMQQNRQQFYAAVVAEKAENLEKARAGDGTISFGAYSSFSKITPPSMSGDYSILYTETHKLSLLRTIVTWSSFDDETATVAALSRIKPGEGDFDPKFYNYGGSYLYLVGALIFAAKSFGVIDLSGGLAGLVHHPDAAGAIYVLARLPGALLSALSVLAVYGIAGRLFNRSTGLIAAAMVAFMPLLWGVSIMAKPHGYAMGWALIALYFALRTREGTAGSKLSTLVWTILAGLAAGMAGGASLGFITIGLGVALLIIRFDPCFAPSLRMILLAATTCLLVYGATNPYLLINLEAFSQTFFIEGDQLGRTSIAYDYLLQEALPNLLIALGYLGYLAPVGALMILAGGKDWQDAHGARLHYLLFTLATVVIWVLVVKTPRLISYVFPVLAILAAAGLERLTLGFCASRAAKGRALAFALVLAIAPNAAVTWISHDQNAKFQQQLSAYRAWALENTPALQGKLVGLVGYPWVNMSPPLFQVQLQDLRPDIVEHHGLDALDKPDYVYDYIGDFKARFPSWVDDYHPVFTLQLDEVRSGVIFPFIDSMTDDLFTKGAVIYKRR